MSKIISLAVACWNWKTYNATSHRDKQKRNGGEKWLCCSVPIRCIPQWPHFHRSFFCTKNVRQPADLFICNFWKTLVSGKAVDFVETWLFRPITTFHSSHLQHCVGKRNGLSPSLALKMINFDARWKIRGTDPHAIRAAWIACDRLRTIAYLPH